MLIWSPIVTNMLVFKSRQKEWVEKLNTSELSTWMNFKINFYNYREYYINIAFFMGWDGRLSSRRNIVDRGRAEVDNAFQGHRRRGGVAAGACAPPSFGQIKCSNFAISSIFKVKNANFSWLASLANLTLFIFSKRS